MSGDHKYDRSGNERVLWMALALTGGFMVAEVIGGLVTGSLALISDAAHMLTDTGALAIALFATRMAKRPPDAKRTYGYARFEILAAAFNAAMLFAVAAYVLYEAAERLRSPGNVESLAMLVIASIGLLVNLASMKLLSAGKDSSMNMKGAYLEVWSDMLGSIGVIAGALIIRYTGWTWVDPIIAVAIALWVLPRTWILLRDSVNVLLEGVPDGIDVATVKAALANDEGVVDVHELHIWTLGSGQISLSAHLSLAPDASTDQVVGKMRQRLIQDFGIQHSTLQCEYALYDSGQPCFTDGDDHGEHKHT